MQVDPVYVVTRQSSDIIAQDDPSVATALRFIKNYAGQAISVPDVVEQARVSRRTLERQFSRALGRSISSEIAQCRLERAKRLLLETDLPSYRGRRSRVRKHQNLQPRLSSRGWCFSTALSAELRSLASCKP